MVKAGLVPTAGVVAAGAIGPVLAFVAIVLGVAAIAGAGRILIGIARSMTLGAGCCSMPSIEREARGGMIKSC